MSLIYCYACTSYDILPLVILHVSLLPRGLLSYISPSDFFFLYSCFFFFKQKTAYEMRISDWSFRRVLFRSVVADRHGGPVAALAQLDPGAQLVHPQAAEEVVHPRPLGVQHQGVAVGDQEEVEQELALCGEEGARSEEHTSELQSLMRISYAVFCLKKKKQQP